jgi:hypothetical protein
MKLAVKSTVDMGSRSGRVKPRTMKLVFVASTLNKQHLGVRADCLARNQDNVFEWSDMSTLRPFQ